ncbi:MAG: 50S ribosome-binding GTPase [Planctomycetaceae bacterium]|jgi:tRNA modification GTPase|nr:50S ribosome-binding GTPase [Planctomycetaceae bacterium]
MLPPIDDTITAQASARGGARRGIVRISGFHSVSALERLFRVPAVESVSGYCPFVAGNQPQIIDGELVLWSEKLPIPCSLYYWSAGRGFTGQQSVELHTIGSQPILDAIVRKLCETGKCRLAGPGEFTLRAFLSGRIDLPQAEAVLGVIDSQNRRQLDAALRQLAGGVGRPLADLRERLLEMLCRLEAEFDFAEEEIEFLNRDELRQELNAALQLVEQTRRQMHDRASAPELPKVVLAGLPNAGKSRLFNALTMQAKQSANTNISAIVSPLPGTTRDYLESKISWNETAFLLLDTAGIEPVITISENEQPRQLAQTFTRDVIEQADVLLLCVECGRALSESEVTLFETNRSRAILVRTKSDKQQNKENGAAKQIPMVFTSAKSGVGLSQLLDATVQRLLSENIYGEVVPATALRCRESLQHAAESLRNAWELLESEQEDMFVAAEIRIALEHLGEIIGAVHNDEVLDRIFSRFCIGK